MNTKINMSVAAILTFILAGKAQAYCPEPMTFSSQSLVAQVNAQLDWLLCLHNEQVGSLNVHADKINSIADNLSSLAVLLRAEGDRIDGIVMREREGFEQVSEMDARIDALERRLKQLEDAQ